MYVYSTIDGRNPAPVDRLVVYPIVYKVLYIPCGCFLDVFSHHQYQSCCSLRSWEVDPA